MAMEPRLPDLAPQRVADLLAHADDGSVLLALDPERILEPAEILRLMLSTSDNPCARWAVGTLGTAPVQAAVEMSGAVQTRIGADTDAQGLLIGHTTARDAVAMLKACLNRQRFPITAFALQHSTRNSRIPLGATHEDVRIAHKTGTLSGVASDVAYLACRNAQVWLAFVTDDQHDTLVTGYEMGICTRSLLEHFGLQVTRTVSAVVSE